MTESIETAPVLSRRALLKTASSAAACAIAPGWAMADTHSADLELCYMPASDLLTKFKAKDLSPVEVLEAQFRRTDAVEERLNNFIATYPEESLAAARASEDRYMKGEGLPLDGITIATKDELAIKGRPLTAGTLPLKDAIADETDPLAERLFADGAIPHAITTVPEMYFAGVTWSKAWGVTRNPWNTKYTVGGSSGGSGGALASGQTTLATGSDMGGSIRIPAAFCGLYGFKPPYGRVPASLGATFLLPSTSGPMARTLKDMILLQNNMAGPTPNSLTALRPKLTLPLEYDGVEGMRIAYNIDQGWAEIEPETLDLFMKAVEGLRSQGATLEEVDLGLGLTGPQIRLAITQALLSGAFGGQMKGLIAYADQLTSYGRYFAEVAATGMGPDEALAAANTIERLNILVQQAVFDNGYQALLSPTLNTSRVQADYDPVNDAPRINGKAVDPHAGLFQTPLWNLLNWYPVVSAPIGLTPYNMPAGMQIVANTFEDAICMQVAAAHEAVSPKLFSGELMPDIG
ncbi:amidase [Ruegeria atlantica]|uniref:Amidase n=1 Tax=Ruegeria atlantica TaxID=81569 RepID=A0A0P1EXT0_9RHOB|nr:amidase [Ruegeria atlantica]CUH47355.1 Amidase [Ruegeria atlantica]